MIESDIFDKLNEVLKSNDIDNSLSLVGSAVSRKEYNDLDFLMAADNVDICKNKIINCFKEYNVSLCDDAVKIGDYYDKEISIAIYSKYDIDNIVKSFVSGKKITCEHRTWCIGYWIPESFIANLRRMWIINDPDDYYKKIKNIINKNSIYAFQCILGEIIEELKIKYELIRKSNGLSYDFYKNDLILASIRGLKLINNEYLVSYKNIDLVIEKLNSNDLNKFINGDISSMDNIINLLINHYNLNNLYLGTWQYSGDFKKMSDQEIIELIKYSKECGIRKFDTALVYGNGRVEKFLGNIISPNDIVLTKIPSKSKPPLENPLSLKNYYDYEYIVNCITESLNNLKRKYIDICLLHNWTYDWNYESELLSWLQEIKEKGLVKKVGISLPNNYDNYIDEKILNIIDVVEAPYNYKNIWIEKYINNIKIYGVEVILRSLFLQGTLKDKSSYSDIIRNACCCNTSLVIGMTTKEQIDNNVKIMKRY